MSNIDESINNEYFSQENIDEALENIITPFLDKHIECGYINGQNNENIYYEKYKINNSKASVVISHGFTESLEKYHELIYYFLQEGYCVYGIEHRGHGRSGSLANLDKVDNTQVNIDNFDYYIEDLKTLIDKVVLPDNENNKLLLYAHSMGGGIGSLFLERYPNYFDIAVLNAPMMEIDTGKVPSFLAKIIANISKYLGKGEKYVIGYGPFKKEPNLNGSATSCENRYMNYHRFLLNNELYQRGDASYNWLVNAFNATKEIVNNAYKVEIPVMLCQAGKDTYVKPNGQNKFSQNAKNCTLKIYPESKHEIYWEQDHIMKPYLDDVFEFYNKNINN